MKDQARTYCPQMLLTGSADLVSLSDTATVSASVVDLLAAQVMHIEVDLIDFRSSADIMPMLLFDN